MSFIVPLLVMNGLGLLCLAIIIFLKRVIAVYGESTLTINNDKKLIVEGGEFLAKALFQNKIYIPSACGGKGTCGFCKVKIKEGISDPLPIEEILLHHKDISSGYRLSCQVKVRRDMGLEIDEELLAIKEYQGVIDSSERLTRDIKRISIKIEEPKEGISFKSGQYILIEVGSAETRAYSIASSTRFSDRVAIEVKLIPNGLGSSYLHSLTEGDKIVFFGPYGQFYLRDTHHKIICVAGGVGLAPMKSIIDDALRRYPNRDVELYYGSRTMADLYDHELYITMAANYDRFSYYPALEKVEEKDREKYPVDEGFVNKSIAQYLENGENSEAYLCGPGPMIDAVVKILIKKGVPEIRILYDKF
ncbi:MAG: 2Fe-2S iron-sulfur cluster binding domain-containing protein [Spirochaetales bacterium]|nr:2Fe-2S iron-sulfur cluster binding domain-containing protein [Spirochaetales bacterium]